MDTPPSENTPQHRGWKRFLPVPSALHLRGAWNKYGLIVIGNVVFFALVYFFSYKPHNESARAAELLSMAQAAETDGKPETAAYLYSEIASSYPRSQANKTASERKKAIQKQLDKLGPSAKTPCAVQCEELDFDEMLRRGPTRYTASFLALQYGKKEEDKPKIRLLVERFLAVALRQEGAKLEDLRNEGAFADPRIRKEFFSPRASCLMSADWIYDDFSVRNDNFFDWTNLYLGVTLKQGARSLSRSVRVASLPAGQKAPLTEFRVSREGGPVTCQLEIKAEQTSGKLTQEL